MLFADYNISIVTSPPGFPTLGPNNTYEYFSGTSLNLICSVTPAPPSNTEFSWSCPSGCFADRKTAQTINVANLARTDSGVLNCSAIINGIQYFSDSFELQVTNGKKFFMHKFCTVNVKAT